MDIQDFTKKKSHFVDVNEIDDRPGPYCMSFGYNLTRLIRSIGRVGVINTPLVIENGDGKVVVIAGYRRIKALKSLGWNKIPCRVLAKSELSPLECLVLNFYDNLSSRTLNDVEKGMTLKRLSSWVERNKILDHYMPLLDLPSNEATLIFYLELEKGLENRIKQYLVDGHLSLHVAKTLVNIDPEARSRLFQLMSSLKFNYNQQKHLIDYMLDISKSENKSIIDLLDEEPIQKICFDRYLNNPQKARAVLRVLRSRLFPKLTHAEKSFEKMVSRLDLPQGITIHSPPFFEASHYRLEVIFKNGKELDERIGRLMHIKGLKDLNDPWEGTA